MRSVKVKICGITNLPDALSAQSLGADMLGFILAKSPRQIYPAKAAAIISQLSCLTQTVGVFVNEKPSVINTAIKKCGFSFVQLSGDESIADIKKIKGAKVIKAVRPEGRSQANALYKKYSPYVDIMLFDTKAGNEYGGTGKTFDWSMLADIKGYFLVAGGINQANCKELVDTFMPHAIDVGSGVEKMPGKKSVQKLRALFKALSE